MTKEQSVIEFYVLCNKLKNVIRTGWKDWNVKKERLESVAEHIYGTQMLAIAMWSQYNYDIDIKKVLTMLALHELEEIIIGDITMFQIDKKTKNLLGTNAVKNLLKNLYQKDELESLLSEYNTMSTLEAKFAFQCDKLECDIQCKLYDEENCVDINDQANNKIMSNELVKSLLDYGSSWSEMWLTFHEKIDNFDENFLAVNNYVKNNKIGLTPINSTHDE